MKDDSASTSIESPNLVELSASKRDGLATASEKRLNELGYRSEFRRDMSLFGVLGISFCSIGILTGMSSAFQTGLFSGGPLGLFWGWNVSTLIFRCVKRTWRNYWRRYVASSCYSLRFPSRKFVVPCEWSQACTMTARILIYAAQLWGDYTSGCAR